MNGQTRGSVHPSRRGVGLGAWVGWLGFGAATTVCACSSGGGGGGTAAAQAFTQQYCDLISPCCSKAGLPGNSQTCQSVVGAFTTSATYDASAGQACLQAMQQASMQSSFCATLGGNPPACNGVFMQSGSGAKGPGQPCSLDQDCAAPAGGRATCYIHGTIVDGGTASSGSCVQLTSGTAGQGPCLGTVDGSITEYSWNGPSAPPGQAFLCNIADGVSCSGTTQKCTALAGTGQPCTQDVDCVGADYCNYGSTGAMPTCAQRLALGASCAGVASNACQSTAYCDPGGQTCKPVLSDGSSCTFDQECQNGSCLNGTCGGAGSGNLGLALLCAQ
jgi:hypothetical protein